MRESVNMCVCDIVCVCVESSSEIWVVIIHITTMVFILQQLPRCARVLLCVHRIIVGNRLILIMGLTNKQGSNLYQNCSLILNFHLVIPGPRTRLVRKIGSQNQSI